MQMKQQIELEANQNQTKRRRGRPKRDLPTVGVYFEISTSLNEKLIATSDNWGVSKTSIVEEALKELFEGTEVGDGKVYRRLADAEEKLEAIATIIGKGTTKGRL